MPPEEDCANEKILAVERDPNAGNGGYPEDPKGSELAVPERPGMEVDGSQLETAIVGEVAKEIGEDQVLEDAIDQGFITRSDVEDSSDEEAAEDAADEEVDLEAPLVEFLELLQECVDDDSSKTPRTDLVKVSQDVHKAVIRDLVSSGPWQFTVKYLLADPRPMPLPELLAALGFSLPRSVFENPLLTPEYVEMGLQVAMRYVMKTRPRLPKPRTLDEVCEVIRNAANILVITGAGISTSLGIPDFRSDDGIYAQLAELGLAEPQEVFDIRVFKEDPAIFYSVAKKILPEGDIRRGTPTHAFVKLLSDRGKLLRNYTQNIDNIEQFVGIPPDKLVQCHGSFGSAHCVSCGYFEPHGEKLFDAIKSGEIPRCPECTQRKSRGKRRKHQDESDDEGEEDEPSFGVMKPDITFFGESLPPRFDELLFDEGDREKCDLVICLGTSLRVSPVSEIVKVVGRQVPQIYISKTPAKHLNFEATFLGSCDDTVELLSQKLGWELHHRMVKRPPGMPFDEFPGGEIEYSDGVSRFMGEEEKEKERKEKEEMDILSKQLTGADESEEDETSEEEDNKDKIQEEQPTGEDATSKVSFETEEAPKEAHIEKDATGLQELKSL